MTIVVGYIPSPEGLAAVDAAIEEATLRHTKLVVVNTGKNGDFNTPVFASPQDLDALDAQLAAAGIEHEVRQATSGRPATDELLTAIESEGADLLVIGLRRRSPHRLHRAAADRARRVRPALARPPRQGRRRTAPHQPRQAGARFDRAATPSRRALPGARRQSLRSGDTPRHLGARLVSPARIGISVVSVPRTDFSSGLVGSTLAT